MIEEGIISQMVTLPSNMFTSVTLPATLWFFDKAKNEDIKDKVLFIDARNYYTVVDKTLNEWSEWQLKNLNAIVWLYRGENEKYKALLAEYRAVLESDAPFEDIVKKYHDEKKALKAEAKQAEESAAKKNKKSVKAEYDEKIETVAAKQTIAKDALWLYEKFGDGEYKDVLGLCKMADISEIEEKGWSLTPGAYVGTAPIEDDGVDFYERMAEIHKELIDLQAESNSLMETISKNMEELGI